MYNIDMYVYRYVCMYVCMKSIYINHIVILAYRLYSLQLYICVCVCVREREGDRARNMNE